MSYAHSLTIMLSFLFPFYSSFYFFLSILDLQCCVSLRCVAKYFSVYTLFFRFFTPASYWILNLVSCAIQQVLKIESPSVQFSSVVSDSLRPHDCCMPGFPVHHQLSELAQTHVHRVSDAIHPSSSLTLLLPSIFLSIRVCSNESVFRVRRPKYWSFRFSISPSNEYSFQWILEESPYDPTVQLLDIYWEKILPIIWNRHIIIEKTHAP